jgi:hypothetical protein
MKLISIFRIFTLAALVVSGAMELWSSELFSTPIEQIGVGAAAGIGAAIIAKVAHIV